MGAFSDAKNIAKKKKKEQTEIKARVDDNNHLNGHLEDNTKQKYGYNLLSVCLESAIFTPRESAKLKVVLWTQGELWPGLTAVSSGCLAPINKSRKNCLRVYTTHVILPDTKANRFGSSFHGTYTFAPNRTKAGLFIYHNMSWVCALKILKSLDLQLNCISQS